MRTCAARRTILWLLVLTLPLHGPGCAWLMNRTDPVLVSCNVPGATITLNGNPISTGKQFLETGEDFVFTADAPGYHPATITVRGKDDFATGYLVLDLLWVLAYGAGIVFIIVDLASGSMWHPTPPNVEFTLLPDASSDLARSGAGRERLLGPEPGRSPPPRHEPPPPPRPDPSPAPPEGPVPLKPPPPPPPAGATDPGELPLAEPLPPPGRTVVLAIGPDVATSAPAAGVLALGQGRRLLGGDATRRAVLRAVREHLERGVGKDDRAVLYFSGRVLRGEDGELYLAAADTDPARLEETAIPAATLSTYLERVEGALLLVVVDADPVAGDAAGSDEVAALLAEGGALAAVAPGQAAAALTRGLAPGAADEDRDARVSGDELSRWLARELGQAGAVRGATGRGALPVIR